MRNRKHYVKIRRINDFRTPLVNPKFFQDCLTVGTVAVAAGIIVKFHVSTVRTLGDVVAKLPDLQFKIACAAFSCTPDT